MKSSDFIDCLATMLLVFWRLLIADRQFESPVPCRVLEPCQTGGWLIKRCRTCTCCAYTCTSSALKMKLYPKHNNRKSFRQVCQAIASLSVWLAKDLDMQGVLCLWSPTIITCWSCDVMSHECTPRLSTFFVLCQKLGSLGTICSVDSHTLYLNNRRE